MYLASFHFLVLRKKSVAFLNQYTLFFQYFDNVLLLLNFWQWMPFFTRVIYRPGWWYFINCHHCWDLGIRGTSPSKWLAILQMDPNIDWTSQDPRSAWNFWPKKGLKGLLATLRRAAFVGYWAEIRNSILLDWLLFCSPAVGLDTATPQSIRICGRLKRSYTSNSYTSR